MKMLWSPKKVEKKKGNKFIWIVCAIIVFVLASVSLFAANVDQERSTAYYISSVGDLKKFRDEVNAGNTFAGITVYQSADIDMRNESNWLPIGIPGSGNYFYGSYNALGHKISNLKSVITEECADVGLFGALAGKVYNLALENFYINGGCVGAIAASSVEGEAVIFNCYTRGLFEATRAGAIADNFAGGKIISCWSDSWRADSTEEVPLCSFDAIEIYNCFTTGKVVNEETYTGKLRDDKIVAADYYKKDEFVEQLNDNLYLICLNNITTMGTLVNWKNSIKGACFYERCADMVNQTLEGDGSKKSPYLLSSIKDLAIFACGVNEGRSFSGYWIRQTCDFDLSVIDSWLPIGVYNSKCYFYGIYDGAGHKIYNIHSEDCGRSRNNGFFGMLGGTVINLGIESGEIYGECIGGISSHASVIYAKILNCYNRATMDGFTRSGGIADNFIGTIENCVYYGKDKDVPLVSYTADYLYRSYSNTSMIDNTYFRGLQFGCRLYKTQAVSSAGIRLEEMVKLLNDNLADTASKQDGIEESDLFRWQIDGETVTFVPDSVVYETESNTSIRLAQVAGVIVILTEAAILYFIFVNTRPKKTK